MRIVLLLVLFVAVTQAWSRSKRDKAYTRWNKWSSSVSTMDKKESEGGLSKWGNRLISKASEKFVETKSDDEEPEKTSADSTVDKTVDAVVGDSVKVDTTDRITKGSDSDDMDKTIRQEDDKSERKEDSDMDKSFDREDKSERKEGKSERKENSSDSDDEEKDMNEDVETETDEKENKKSDSETKVSRDQEKKELGRSDSDDNDFETDKDSDEEKVELPKFDDEKETSMGFVSKFGKRPTFEGKLDFPKFDLEDKVPGNFEEAADSTKLPPNSDFHDLEDKVSDLEGKDFSEEGVDKNSDREGSSKLDTKDSGSSDEKVKHFGWRKPFHPRPAFPTFNKDKESGEPKDEVVVDDVSVNDEDVTVDTVVEDVVEPVIDVETTVEEGEPLGAVVVPDAPSTPCENCGPARRKL